MMVLAALPGMGRELLVSGDLAKPGNFSATVNLLDCRIGKVGLEAYNFDTAAREQVVSGVDLSLHLDLDEESFESQFIDFFNYCAAGVCLCFLFLAQRET